jgi:hypothetical protein
MNLNEKNPKPGTHVEESVKDLKTRVDKHPIDFNKLLPTDINSNIYDISKAKEFNDFEKHAAESTLGTRTRNDGTGLLSAASSLLNPDAFGKKVNDLNITKAASVINGTMSKDLKESDDRDLFALYSSCVIVANALTKNNQNVNVDYSDKQGEGASKEEFAQANQTQNYQLPEVSPDTLMNEIYNYIKSK